MSAALDPERHAAEPGSTDADLARQALGDPEAFAELYRRYRTRVYWYLRARTPSDEDAADVTQQVFVGAFDRLRQYREDRASFATWLFAIARNAAADFHRRRRPSVNWDRLPDILHPADDRDPAAGAIRSEDLDRLHVLLEHLPAGKRELLALRYAAGLTIPEVAALLGKSEQATYKQLSRLLQTLEDAYHDPHDQP
jgi:RNA polymerase sigma-70 factor (ECF subfamily)